MFVKLFELWLILILLFEFIIIFDTGWDEFMFWLLFIMYEFEDEDEDDEDEDEDEDEEEEFEDEEFWFNDELIGLLGFICV